MDLYSGIFALGMVLGFGCYLCADIVLSRKKRPPDLDVIPDAPSKEPQASVSFAEKADAFAVSIPPVDHFGSTNTNIRRFTKGGYVRSAREPKYVLMEAGRSFPSVAEARQYAQDNSITDYIVVAR